VKELKERAKKDGYEFITVYRWTTTLEPQEFTIGPKDDDGYLSVWKDLASQRSKSYNVPMLAMFKTPRQGGDKGWLIRPYVQDVKVLQNPILRDPNGHLHYSFEYFGMPIPYGYGNQGDIPDRLADYAQGLGLQPGEFRDPFWLLK
jgi:hypothetical protein